MKPRFLLTLSAICLSAALTTELVCASPVVFAGFTKTASAKKGGAKAKAKAKGKLKGGELAKEIQLAPKGVRWGMGGDELVRAYSAHFEDQFRPRYKTAEPGTQTDALDAELRDLKQSLKKSRIEFGEKPTGVDYTPLKGEYSYRNGESLMRVTVQNGLVRNFFFFNDKLWKVYDEYQLKREKQLGPTYDKAVAHLTKTFGAKPVALEADSSKHRLFSEHTWFDKNTYIRAVDRSDVLGLVYADRSVEENLDSYRKNTPVDKHVVDNDVAEVTKQEEPAADPAKKATKPKK